MATLPAYFIDNVGAFKSSSTVQVRGNKVSDCYGNTITGITVQNCTNLRMKSNKVLRMRTAVGSGNNSYGYKILDCNDTVMVYNVASRCYIGFDFYNLPTLSIYNITTHDCVTHLSFRDNTSGAILRNACFSNYIDNRGWQTAVGIVANAGIKVNTDYVVYFGMGSLGDPDSITYSGGNVQEIQPLYVDEPNDDLTPDNISVLLNNGTENPLRSVDPDIGGIESEITDEETSSRRYHEKLMDDEFWDIDNDSTAEVSLIKAFQSRILANTELAISSAKRDLYIKEMDSALGFSELWPMYSYYANESKFKKRVKDLFYSTQNVGTTQAMQNSIGGYNLFPTFFKRLEDWEDTWIIAQSAVDYDNVLLGSEGVKYGIGLDVIGLSTMSTMASAECYENTQKGISDIAPVHWNLHSYPQPDTYYLFTDMWNYYENCTLENMQYNDDFNIEVDELNQTGKAITPAIPTQATSVTGAITTGYAPSGDVEVSLLDRVYSEEIDRNFYYRQGASSSAMGTWVEVANYIGGQIQITSQYVQFKVQVDNVQRRGDYEFIGFCLRPYLTDRIETEPTTQVSNVLFDVWIGGSSVYGWKTSNWTQLRDNSIELESIQDMKVYDYDDIWAVGSHKLAGDSYYTIAHWDGITWDEYPPHGYFGEFFTMASYGTDNMWVGGYNQNTNAPSLYKWNGIAWNSVDIPSSADGGTDEADIWKILSFGINDLWIFGPNWEEGLNNPFVMNWDGEDWVIKPIDGINFKFTSAWGTNSNNIWVTGARTNEKGAVYKWDGTQFTKQIATGNPGEGWVKQLWDIHGFSASDIWAVGSDGCVMQYDGIIWNKVSFPDIEVDLHSIWGNSSTDLYVVGTKGDPTKRYLYKYNGAIWTLIKSETTPDDSFYEYEFNVVTGK